MVNKNETLRTELVLSDTPKDKIVKAVEIAKAKDNIKSLVSILEEITGKKFPFYVDRAFVETNIRYRYLNILENTKNKVKKTNF